MELIKDLGTRLIKDHWFRFGKFKCLFCLQEVERRLSQGIKQKSCGCVHGKLISESKKGIKKSEKHRQKISETRIKNGTAKGKNNPFYGKKHKKETIQKFKDKIFSENTRELISEKIKEKWTQEDYINKQINRPKDSLSNWQGGISFIVRGYGIEFNKQLKRQILKRDAYICQNPLCDVEIKNYKGLDIHHIDYNKKNNNPENLITLCKNCHAKTFGKNNRGYWVKYYQQLL